ncbi:MULTISPECIES: hypothetical protein [Xenorhabdus]|uniref:hypothetical protein n=1 Tax=Xenorhabdus TaxID=626 RepID=UPI0006486C11|nr:MULTISPECIES: hypothetical protein [Xenorhabdus]
MFKKLLTVGALAAALIGGIGTSSAFQSCPSERILSESPPFTKYVVNPYNNFDNVFTQYESYIGKTITWRIQSSPEICKTNSGNMAYFALYSGN